MANPEHVAIVKQGADALRQWQEEHPFARLDLWGADLRGAHLTGAVLWRANLTDADLEGTVLIGAHLADADLSDAILTNADLSDAVLTAAQLGYTALAECDLSSCKGLSEATHRAPSHVSVDTLGMTLQGHGGEPGLVHRRPSLPRSRSCPSGPPRERPSGCRHLFRQNPR